MLLDGDVCFKRYLQHYIHWNAIKINFFVPLYKENLNRTHLSGESKYSPPIFLRSHVFTENMSQYDFKHASHLSKSNLLISGEAMEAKMLRDLKLDPSVTSTTHLNPPSPLSAIHPDPLTPWATLTPPRVYPFSGSQLHQSHIFIIRKKWTGPLLLSVGGAGSLSSC